MKIYPYLHPVPIVLVGTKNENGRANFATIGDVAVAGLNPPLLMISLHENHLSRENVDRLNKFSINVPEVKLLKEVDYCGMVSGRQHDKSEILDTVWYEDEIPYVRGVPFVHFCKVLEKVQVQRRVIYIGEIFDQIIRDDIDRANLNGLGTILYGLDNRYYMPGEQIGTGYGEGNKIHQSGT